MKFITLISILFFSCNSNVGENMLELSLVDDAKIINREGKTIKERFNTPKGYVRVKLDSTSFGSYLRNISLTKYGDTVSYFDKSKKVNDNVYISVLDQEIGARDLQQCADAVMRLKGEYHFRRNEIDSIHFNFLSDGKPRYFNTYSNKSYKSFLKYMNYIFAFANTSSLYDELIKVPNINNVLPGDVFIQKGNPFGHAVTVMDVAMNELGEKVFILSQSYMPAQETQILVNRNNKEFSPWYKARKGKLFTPEWTFTDEDLRRFP